MTMWHEKIDPVQKIPHREMNVDDFNVPACANGLDHLRQGGSLSQAKTK